MNTQRIHLLATPRNISTALMYAFNQRPDTIIFDEPLYAHYLIHSKADHPGREETIASMETDANQVIEKIFLGDHASRVIFIKNMTHHLIGLDKGFLKQLTNFLLIRDPYEMLTSYSKVNPNPSMSDIGIKMQFELYNHLTECGHIAALVDARSILQQPRNMLSLLCRKLDIEFNDCMLSWPAGPRKEDGVWAKYWYENVHRSTGFQPYKKRRDALPNHLVPLYEEAKTYYDYLFERSLQLP